MDKQLSTKLVKCPQCDHVISIQGLPGEQKILTCENCHSKGYFTFPETKTYKIVKTDSFSDSIAIDVKNLTKSYKQVLAVNNISFQVKRGEIFGFLGPNGAGKTTTIRTLLGYLKPNQGEAYIFGKNIKHHIVELRKHVGYIPGELALYEHLTGRQFLQYFSSIRNTDLILLEELLEIFELPLDRKIKGYSRGMKQKMGIIQAFMDDPEIVIMDEPTTGLDPLLQQKFYDFLRNEKMKGKTLFLSSHILSEVEKICDRVAIIREGNIVALESIDNLKRKKGKKIRLKLKGIPKELTQFPNARIANGWIEFITEEDIDSIIKKISKYTVLDLEVLEFSLEDIFMRYYDTGGEV